MTQTLLLPKTKSYCAFFLFKPNVHRKYYVILCQFTYRILSSAVMSSFRVFTVYGVTLENCESILYVEITISLTCVLR